MSINESQRYHPGNSDLHDNSVCSAVHHGGNRITATNIYDQEEVHENCTVQIWKNSQTGEVSIGWWEN